MGDGGGRFLTNALFILERRISGLIDVMCKESREFLLVFKLSEWGKILLSPLQNSLPSTHILL